jgi:3-phytase
VSAPLGPDFPRGLLVVQDGCNALPGAPQNFKLVSWERIAVALGLGVTATSPR